MSLSRDPDFRSRYMADVMRERDEKHWIRRGWWSGAIDAMIDGEGAATLGGWRHEKWQKEVPELVFVSHLR